MNQPPNPSPSLTKAAEKITDLFKIVGKTFRELLFEKARQHGLTIPQLWVIFQLHKKPYQNLFELSKTIGLSKSTVSGIVSRLVARGIVIREIPEDNRRTVKLSLAPQFVKINDLLKLRNEFFIEIVADATTEELASIIVGLETLASLMNSLNKPTAQKAAGSNHFNGGKED
jgi:DNA-binding MarR family transcriptional regulator